MVQQLHFQSLKGCVTAAFGDNDFQAIDQVESIKGDMRVVLRVLVLSAREIGVIDRLGGGAILIPKAKFLSRN
jgi:predicted transcriptional regulator of viral defense system